MISKDDSTELKDKIDSMTIQDEDINKIKTGGEIHGDPFFIVE